MYTVLVFDNDSLCWRNLGGFSQWAMAIQYAKTWEIDNYNTFVVDDQAFQALYRMGTIHVDDRMCQE